MKITISYIAAEEREATGVLAALLQRRPGAKVRRDKSKLPRLAVYVVIDKKGPDVVQ